MKKQNASDATAKFRFQQHDNAQYRFITKSVKTVCKSNAICIVGLHIEAFTMQDYLQANSAYETQALI